MEEPAALPRASNIYSSLCADATQNEGLYAEMGRWVDASTMEEQLAKAAERQKKALTGKELAALKARKQEMKRKKTMGWLMR